MQKISCFIRHSLLASPEAARTGRFEVTSPSTVEFLAKQPLPFEIKTVVVDPQGQTAQRKSADTIRFRFKFDEIDFQAEAARTGDNTRLRIVACIGRMPYSAESLRKRIDVAAVLSAGRNLPYGCFFVDQNQNIWLESHIDVEQPMTPVSVVAATTAILMATRSWLGLLMGVLLRPGDRGRVPPSGHTG